jgi:hypothetical protein
MAYVNHRVQHGVPPPGRSARRLQGLASPVALLGLLGLLALLGLGASADRAPASGSAVSVLSSVHVSADAPGTRHVEPVLAVNPRNPRNLIAAVMVLGERGGVAVYASQDGGHTWKRAANGPLARPLFGDGHQDPVVAFDPEGNAYLGTLGDQLAVWKSSDGGQAWAEPAVVPGTFYDRPWLACDRSGSEALRGRIYAVAHRGVTVFDHPFATLIAVSSSRDGAGTFDFPRLFMPAPEKELINSTGGLLATPEGKLILVLQAYAPDALQAPLLPPGHYSTIVSEDGGRTFTRPRPGPAFHVYGHAWEGKSLLGVGGGGLAQDTSPGAWQNRLYLTWLDAIDGTLRVMAASSGDGGASWSRPLRVSDGRSATDESTPAIAVNDEGVVGISWYDRRGDPTDRCYQLFFAASADGGATFSPSRRVAGDFSCPVGRPPAAGAGSGPGGGPGPGADPAVDPVNVVYRFKNAGDTQGLVGLPHGSFHLAWINGSAGELQLWSTEIAVDRSRLAAAPARDQAGGRR